MLPKATKSREVANFINDEKALVKMEESRSVTIGFASSEAVGETRLHNALDNIASEVNAALHFSDYLSDDDYMRIGRLKTKLERLLPSSNEASIRTLVSNVAPRFSQVSAHYSDLNIRGYRKISGLNIGKLRRINLFVGENNSGKTSLLEAVYLLAQLNDLNAFLDLERFRGKFFRDFNALWVDKNFISPIDIAGHFNGLDTQVRITKEETQENIDRTAYISTIRVDANRRRRRARQLCAPIPEPGTGTVLPEGPKAVPLGIFQPLPLQRLDTHGGTRLRRKGETDRRNHGFHP